MLYGWIISSDFDQLESKDHALSFKIWADPPSKMGLIFHFRNLKIILIWLQIILKMSNFPASADRRHRIA